MLAPRIFPDLIRLRTASIDCFFKIKIVVKIEDKSVAAPEAYFASYTSGTSEKVDDHGPSDVIVEEVGSAVRSLMFLSL